MFSNTLTEICIHLSWRALEKQPGRKTSLTVTLEGRDLLEICYWKKSHLQNTSSYVSYVNRYGYAREEATCFPYLKALPTINLDTSLFFAPLLHQGSKCSSEDQREGNRKLPLHAECWCSSCYGCVGAFFDNSTGSSSHQLWSLTSFNYLEKDSLLFICTVDTFIFNIP